MCVCCPCVPLLLCVLIQNNVCPQALFRVMFAGTFSQLQASVASSNQLQPLLSTLLAVHKGPHAGPLRPIVVELCLTLPVQLQHLLPVIPQIMPQLLTALKARVLTGWL